METKLSASYVDPTEPGSLGGIAKFAKAHKIPVSQAKKELQQVLSYTLHKPRRRRFKTLPTLGKINEQFVMDLVDMQKLAKYNKGYKYLLTVIDVLSKFAWVEPLKRKRATAMVEALQRLWARFQRNRHLVSFIRYEKRQQSEKTQCQVGDKVRLNKKFRPVKKGYLPGWTEEVFLVKQIYTTKPVVTYKLMEWDGSPIKGTFYEPDLQEVNVADDSLFRIDQVLKRKGKQVFVSWRGLAEKI